MRPVYVDRLRRCHLTFLCLLYPVHYLSILIYYFVLFSCFFMWFRRCFRATHLLSRSLSQRTLLFSNLIFPIYAAWGLRDAFPCDIRTIPKRGCAARASVWGIICAVQPEAAFVKARFVNTSLRTFPFF